MKTYLIIFFFFFMMTGTFSQTRLFDTAWRYHRGGMQGAEAFDFDDSGWRIVDIPHDWSIEDLPGTESPFDHNAISQVSGGYTVGGTGWYRKTFTISEDQKNKKVFIQFDGVYMNSDFWLNGERLGNHPYGYTGFWFDITSKIHFGKKNIIAVQVKNEGQNSRWYTGSGIYRHVWLIVTEPVHVTHWGTKITTAGIRESSADITVVTSLINETSDIRQVRLITQLLDSTGTEKSKIESILRLEPGKIEDIIQNITFPNPGLWSTDSPVLYTAVNELYSGEIMLDRTETEFGIRTIEFSADQGFLLNGNSIKLKGGCVHHDNGPLGSKAYDRAEERRVELLKSSGFNAIRCAHNPPSPAFLSACDRLGMLVIDEVFDMWRLENNPYDYHLYFDKWWIDDIESFIKRDWNHPSIILWSIGNEIREMERPEVIAVENMLAEKVRALDPTRPVTAAVNNLRPQKDVFFSHLDVCGYNYAAGGEHVKDNIYVLDHTRVPERIMFGSESFPMEAFNSWMPVLDNTFVLGDFVWTAFDYIGEASIGWRGYWQEDFFPWNLAYCGDIDICGWKRPQSYYRDVLWNENQLSLFISRPAPLFPLNPNKKSWSKWDWYDVVADWNWPGYDNQPFTVVVYSSCGQVDLLLNGKSFGMKKTDRNSQFKAEWQVPYTAGELKAIGYNGLDIVTTSILQTAGEIASIKITPDRKKIKANGQDLSYITIELTDKMGIRNPKADNLVRFIVEGNGTIAGVGNGNPVSLESYQLPQRKARLGRCMVVLKSTGSPGIIKLTALVDQLPPSTVSIITK
jgi:beta-galactosidase